MYIYTYMYVYMCVHIIHISNHDLGQSNLLFPQQISIVQSRPCSLIAFYLLCLHMFRGCRSCPTLLRNTQTTKTPRVICMYVCVCVCVHVCVCVCVCMYELYVLYPNTTHCHVQHSTVHSLHSGLTFEIQIDAHQSKLVVVDGLVGRVEASVRIWGGYD